MDRESLHKLIWVLTIVLAVASVVNVIRWVCKMAMGLAVGVPADIAFVLRLLEAILLCYVACNTYMNREDMLWQVTAEGQLNRKLFLVAMVTALSAIVVEQVALV